MSYSSTLAAALSGASPGQLAHWRRDRGRGSVLIPEFSAVRPVLYSFRDVVALRTCAYLRRDQSLQKVRTAIANLRRIGELEHLSEYRLVSDGTAIYLVQRDQAVALMPHRGQHVMAEMSEVLRPFVNRADVEVPNLRHPREHVSVEPGIRGGYPVIAGTRVPYDNVVGLLRDGVPAGR